jgi:predicted phosphodiesterase
MNKPISKRRISVWLKLIIAFILLGVGFAGGFKLYEKGNEAGCFPLEDDIVPVEITPFRADHLQVIALGDTGTGNEDQLKVADGMAKVCDQAGCDFVLLLGDNFYPNGVKSILDKQFYTKFEHVYKKIKKPFFAVLGNHDVKQNAFAQTMYSLRSDYWRMPNYEYSFKASPARFYGLNTNCPFFFERLRNKLNRDEEELKANANKFPWTIAFGHHSVYSNGSHGDTDVITRNYWNWILDGRIDLYLAGHNHHLSLMQYGETSTEYVISGAGGKHYRTNSEREKTNTSEASSIFTYNDTGFVWLDISIEKILIRFHDSTGNILYEFTKTR